MRLDFSRIHSSSFQNIVAKIHNHRVKAKLKPALECREISLLGQTAGTRYHPSRCSSKMSLTFSPRYSMA
jgi:hypothetical protein